MFEPLKFAILCIIVNKDSLCVCVCLKREIVLGFYMRNPLHKYFYIKLQHTHTKLLLFPVMIFIFLSLIVCSNYCNYQYNICIDRSKTNQQVRCFY